MGTYNFGYWFGGLKKMDKTSGWTKKEIFEFVQEYPENKLW